MLIKRNKNFCMFCFQDRHVSIGFKWKIFEYRQAVGRIEAGQSITNVIRRSSFHNFKICSQTELKSDFPICVIDSCSMHWWDDIYYKCVPKTTHEWTVCLVTPSLYSSIRPIQRCKSKGFLQHIIWTLSDFCNFILADESKYALLQVEKLVRVWREVEKRKRPQNMPHPEV